MSSPAPETNFKFWAIKIPKNSEKSLKMDNDNFVYHVSNATLGQGVSRGRTTLFCKANGEEAAICNLVHSTIENASLDLIVSRSMNASFVVKGPNAVTVSGYVQPLVEDDEGEMLPVGDSSRIASAIKVAATIEEEEVEGEKESKKRKLEEVEAAQAAKPPQKKRNKEKRKKRKNLQGEGTAGKEVEEVENKSAKMEPAPKVAKDQSTPKGKKSKKMVKAGKGVKYRVLKKGNAGASPAKKGDSITLLYIGCLKDGTQFDKNLKEGLTFKIGGNEVIPGMELGVEGMCPEEKRRIIIPPEQGYGKEGASEGKIPPNSELHFTVQRK